VAQVAELLQGRAPQGAVNAQQATRWRQATRAPQAA
jgi:D-3-phosphoglycerate dehydrogenase